MKPEQKKLWNKLLDEMKNDNISCHLHFAKLYTSRFPDRGAGWMALADVLSKMARYSEARDALKRAKLLCPKERLYIVFGGFGDFFGGEWEAALMQTADTRSSRSPGP